MLFLRSVFPGLLVAALLSGSGLAAAPKDAKWVRLEGCKWMENESNDGDSFHVKYDHKEFIFRLYFVDTCESSEQIPKRVQQQAKFFGITTDRVLEAGKVAKELTHRYLSNQSFTVVTRWEDAMGASRLPRNYAFILFGENDRHDLASTLIHNGLARVYGMPADPPGPITAAQFQSDLLKLDTTAKQKRLGIYGNLSSHAGAAGSGVGGGAPTAEANSSNDSSPVSMLLPSTSHPPDVVDNPPDDGLEDYAIPVPVAPMQIQTTIPESNYSEIPGFKPSTKPAADATPTETPIPDEAQAPKPSE